MSSPVEVVSLVIRAETIIISPNADGLDLGVATNDVRRSCMLLLTPNGYVLEHLHSRIGASAVGGTVRGELRDL
jgi:hypothetical protein